jgi:hypothetical protein
MKFSDIIPCGCKCEPQKEVNVGKIVFKTVAITTAVLAFIPTVIKVNKGKGFDAYGLLSRVSYTKGVDEEGKTHYNVLISLIDLSRYGIGIDKEDAKENEDSIGIEE